MRYCFYPLVLFAVLAFGQLLHLQAGFAVEPTLTASDAEAVEVMTLKVRGLRGNESRAQQLTEQLKAISGIDAVQVDLKSGQVKVHYVKARLGCCSKVHSSLEQHGWKYKLMADTGAESCCGSKASCSKSKL